MLCPTCKTPLTMSERQGIEIDYCPSCRGVWLDRGELDKIVERSAVPPAAAPVQPPPHQQPQWNRPGFDHGQHPHRKRRRSFLEELFD
jgi:Zn-finger nucleic acid-binding protein